MPIRFEAHSRAAFNFLHAFDGEVVLFGASGELAGRYDAADATGDRQLSKRAK